MQRASANPILIVAGIAGACTMAVELAAVRLIAPWFGTSSRVWTNVIGVILLALAVGYLLGARWAAAPRPRRALGWTLLAAALWTAWMPFLAGAVCRLFLPDGIGLDRAIELWTWGSLASTLVLFLPAAVCLGCVGPLALEVVQRTDGSSAGSAGGRVLGWSTLGSLAGTFVTTHVLVPWLGLSWTFLGVAGVLFVLGAALALAERARGAAALSMLATAAALGFSRLERGAPPPGVALLEERESCYQSVRAVEDSRWGEPVRLLQVNEGLDSFQSVWKANAGLLGPGYYYDLFALPAWWSGARGRWKVAVLGLGAGTACRVLRGASPEGVELEIVGLELDPVVTEFGERHFELDARRERVIAGVDARAALRTLERDFDLIVLDAYARQVEIPFHLSSEEALAEMRSHLAPGGWLAINVGGFGFDDPVVSALSGTLARAFGSGVGYRVSASRNFVLFARRDGDVPVPSDARFWFASPVGDALLPALSVPSAWSRLLPCSAALALCDDRNPIDELQMQSLEQARARLANPR
ncbi:MAG: hypothetical protein FJ298_12295 [Planctomycetes bacterium]|nr:hypothetical protein [Planctomycetota bacterium]